MPLSPHKNPTNPYISVVIPAYNESRYIEPTLERFLHQTDNNFELIVVDNNSTDNTGEIAKKYGARVLIEKSAGVAHARQKGCSEAKGEIIASTDSDTLVPDNWIETIAKKFKDNPDMVGYGGQGTLYSGPLTAKVMQHALYPFWVVDRVFSHGWNLIGYNMAMRKDAFIKAGGYKTELKQTEDIELSKRLRAVGRVVFDHRFYVATSGRRYKDGFLKGVMTYIPSWIARNIFKKDNKFLDLPTIR